MSAAAAIMDCKVRVGGLSKWEIQHEGAFQLKIPTWKLKFQTSHFKWNTPLPTIPSSSAVCKKQHVIKTHILSIMFTMKIFKLHVTL